MLNICLIISIKAHNSHFNYTLSSGDMHIYTAIQNKYVDPQLYTRDVYFNIFSNNYQNVANIIIAALIILFEDINFVYLLVNLALFMIFWFGNYLLAKKAFRSDLAGVIFSVICSYGIKLPYGSYWGIILGVVETRDFFIAFIPLIFLLLLKVKDKPHKTSIVFLMIGVLSNIHMISGLSFFAVLLFSLFLYKHDLQSMRWYFFYSLIFLICFSPTLLQGIQIEDVTPPLHIMEFRIASQYQIPLMYFFLSLCIPLILTLFFYSFLKNKIPTPLNFFNIAAIIFFNVSLITSLTNTFLAPFQFVRALNLLVPVLYLGCTYIILRFFKSRNLVKHLIGISLIVLLTLPPNYFISRSCCIKDIDLRIYVDKDLELSASILTRSYRTESIIEVSDWMMQETNKGALFSINPYFASVFRAIGKRGIVLSFKDGGNLILARNKHLNRWYTEIKRASSLYLSNSTPDFIDYARDKQSEYVVIERKYNHLDLPIVFINDDFIIYDVQQYLN